MFITPKHFLLWRTVPSGWPQRGQTKVPSYRIIIRSCHWHRITRTFFATIGTVIWHFSFILFSHKNFFFGDFLRCTFFKKLFFFQNLPDASSRSNGISFANEWILGRKIETIFVFYFSVFYLFSTQTNKNEVGMEIKMHFSSWIYGFFVFDKNQLFQNLIHFPFFHKKKTKRNYQIKANNGKEESFPQISQSFLCFWQFFSFFVSCFGFISSLSLYISISYKIAMPGNPLQTYSCLLVFLPAWLEF